MGYGLQRGVKSGETNKFTAGEEVSFSLDVISRVAR